MTGSISPTHVAYSDETKWNDGRYRAVAVVSLSIADSQVLGPQLKSVLSTGFSEAKWKKLNSERRARTAIAALLPILDAAVERIARVDALVWDIEDTRHRVRGRCDVANLERMNYHAYRHALAHWPPNAWWVAPDEHEDVDWNILSDVLANAGTRSLPKALDGTQSRQHLLVKLEPRSSTNAVFVQLADLVAGMAAYSRERFDSYAVWRDGQSGQTTLLDETTSTLSNRDRARWLMLHCFHAECKRRKLQVSLSSSRGLETKNPALPVNFWLWRPQGAYDKAPTRSA